MGHFSSSDAGGYIYCSNRLPLRPRREAGNNQPPETVREVLLRTWMCSAPADVAHSKRKGAAD